MQQEDDEGFVEDVGDETVASVETVMLGAQVSATISSPFADITGDPADLDNLSSSCDTEVCAKVPYNIKPFYGLQYYVSVFTTQLDLTIYPVLTKSNNWQAI